VSAGPMEISADGVALLQKLARDSENARGRINAGWLPHTPDYKPLVWLGLIEVRERVGGGVELRLTEFGWSMLADGIEAVAVRNVNATLDAEAELEKARAATIALAELVRLKNLQESAPEIYRAEVDIGVRDEAWRRARAALAVEGERDG
jgi:hypothetical protein